jgi:tryptophan-rich sensory protein
MRISLKKITLFIISLLIPQLAGFIGSLFTIKNIPTWYASLSKPFFNPPNWIFAPVWTALFILMGVSLYLVLTKQKKISTPPVKIFFIQLAINTLWSIVFFGMREPGLAFIIIVVLWFLIYYIIKIFYKIDKVASYLLLPYLAWVSFASVLNFSIWILNY